MDCGTTGGTLVWVAPESVISVSSDVMGTEGFAVLAAAAECTLVGGWAGSMSDRGMKRP